MCVCVSAWYKWRAKQAAPLPFPLPLRACGQTYYGSVLPLQGSLSPTDVADRYTAHVVPQFAVHVHGWGALLGVVAAVEAAAAGSAPGVAAGIASATGNLTALFGRWRDAELTRWRGLYARCELTVHVCPGLRPPCVEVVGGLVVVMTRKKGDCMPHAAHWPPSPPNLGPKLPTLPLPFNTPNLPVPPATLLMTGFRERAS